MRLFKDVQPTLAKILPRRGWVEVTYLPPGASLQAPPPVAPPTSPASSQVCGPSPRRCLPCWSPLDARFGLGPGSLLRPGDHPCTLARMYDEFRKGVLGGRHLRFCNSVTQTSSLHVGRHHWSRRSIPQISLKCCRDVCTHSLASICPAGGAAESWRLRREGGAADGAHHHLPQEIHPAGPWGGG